MQNILLDLIRDQKCLTENQTSRFYRRKGKYDNIFVINMANRQDRLETCKKTLDKVNLKFERFVAINGKHLIDNTNIGKELHKKFDILRPGELGCLLSHLCILALAASHYEDNYTIVFEDDIVTSSEGNLEKLFRDLDDLDQRESIDIVYLGKCLERCTKLINIKDNIYRAAAPSCTHALMIKNSYAKKILQDLDNCSNSAINCDYFNRGIDSIYGDHIVNGIGNGLVIHPAIFYQDVLTGGSDLRKEFLINYQECNDTNPCNCPEPEIIINEIKSNKAERIIIITLIVIIIIIFILLLSFGIYVKRGKIKSIYNRKSKYGKIIAIVIIALIILFIIILSLRRNSKPEEKKEDKPDWLKEFKPCPNPAFPIKLIEGAKCEDFILDTSSIASKEYDVFNPNGIIVNNKVLTTTRCSNSIVSYPIIQILELDMNKILFSKRSILKSNSLIVNRKFLGFEDMRVFIFDNDIYLIGVNLDRRVDNIPSMSVIKLNEKFDNIGKINEDIWHLNYEPVNRLPNKNWSPLTLYSENGEKELGFIVDIDPLLIVKRIKSNGKFSSDCEIAYESKQQTGIEKLRNSTITYHWKDVPEKCRNLFEKFSSENHDQKIDRYVLMGHTKYVEADYVKDAWTIIYQHYFVIIDINVKTKKCKIHTSKPFHLEEENKPHIEYVSGFCFIDDEIVIFYGLRDKQCKYLKCKANSLIKHL